MIFAIADVIWPLEIAMWYKIFSDCWIESCALRGLLKVCNLHWRIPQSLH